jgi:hypothetical protein
VCICSGLCITLLPFSRYVARVGKVAVEPCGVSFQQPWVRRRSRFTSGPRNNFGWTASPSSKRIILVYIVLKRSKEIN